MKPLAYRREIDGLRAVAVIPVMLFHAGFGAFSGGFVGVDVFFVISGYLITGILLAEQAAGRYTLRGFYERRARRILPALFVVLTACLPAAWFWMIPEERNSFAQSLLAVSAFASNFHFWEKSDYFGAAAENKPLLHTWSLAVEEQFYVIFPLLLMWLCRVARRRLVLVLVTAGVASLGLAQYLAGVAPEAGFYLLPSRAWELLIGAVLAVTQFDGPQRPESGARAQVASALGIAMIGFSIVAFGAQTPFPSVYALVPTIGTALVIRFASPSTFAGRFLGLPILVGIGLISYSAYLWHQPLYAFARVRGLEPPTSATFGALMALALVLAYITWRFVEQPFRDRKRMQRKTIFWGAATASVVMLAIGAIGDKTDGFARAYVAQLTPEQQRIYSFLQYDRDLPYKKGTCFLLKQQGPEEFARECAPHESGPRTVLLWGDSHAASFASGLRNLVGDASVAQYTASACAPVAGISVPSRPNCDSVNEFVIGRIAELRPPTVILMANWLQCDALGGIGLIPVTIRQIHDASPESRVIVLGSLPQWESGLPITLIRRGVALKEGARVPTQVVSALRKIDARIDAATTASNAKFVSIIDASCDGENCLAAAANLDHFDPIAWDYGHLTEAGAAALATRLQSAILP